jgi:hypothetical protein
MRSHLRLIALVAAAAAGFAGLVPAQEASKLGMVNSQEILDKSVEGQRVLAQLQAGTRSTPRASPGWTIRSSSSRTG